MVRQIESLGEPEVSSEHIGRLVMEGLRNLDEVAYVRFASVYQNFNQVDDFRELLSDLSAGQQDVK